MNHVTGRGLHGFERWIAAASVLAALIGIVLELTGHRFGDVLIGAAIVLNAVLLVQRSRRQLRR